MERDHHVELTDGGKYNFNSHAHVERDPDEILKYLKVLTISTHTLTWSVTGEALKHIVVPKISTHTLTWSVTYDVTLFRHKR